MKHIKLFEGFSESLNLLEIAESMIQQCSTDPDLAEYKFSVDIKDIEIALFGAETSDVCFIIWDNPTEVQAWRESGYGEGYDEGDNVPPMPVLALIMKDGNPHCYALSPEEKYYKLIFVDDEDNLDDSQLFPLNDFSDFKRALNYSIWEME